MNTKPPTERSRHLFHRVKSHHHFMSDFMREAAAALTRPAFIFLFFLYGSFVLVCASGIYYVELGTNPHIQSFFDASYYMVTLVTGVGLGDIVPITTMGRIISMIAMTVGTAVYISITAVVAATILSVEYSRRPPN